MLLEIKDFKGIATQADPNDLGLEFAFSNENFLLDTPGSLVKAKGRGSHTDIASTRMSSLVYWSPSNLKTDGTAITPTWIGYDAHNDILRLISVDFTTVTNCITYSSNKPGSFDLRDHGVDFRLAPDNLNQKPKILQHISRKFFEGAVTIDDYVFQDATPTYPADNEMFLDSASELLVGENTGLSLAANSYNYKISPIFDGLQELPLSDSFLNITPTLATKAGKVTVSFANQTSSGTAPNKTYGFNPRITSFKLYREIASSGHYYELLEVPINTLNNSANVITDGSVDGTTALQSVDYVYSSSFIDSYSSLSASNGIFSMPDATMSVAYNNMTVAWYILMRDSNGVLDSVNSPTNSPSVFGGVTGTNSSGNIWTFNASNGPLNNSTWLAQLAQGILPVNANPSESNRHYNFNEKCQILRVYYGERTSDGQPTFTGSPTATVDIINTVWHNKAIVYSMANSKRFGPGGANGNIAVDDSGGQHIVLDSVGKAVKLESTSSFSNGDVPDLFKNYVITVGSTNTTIDIYDTGYTNGAVQPYADEIILNTRYKYSQMIGDRLFVGNVQLDPDGNKEDHPDWVVYSEPNQPDILPSINYIQIKDQQGGFITGLNRVLDNLVVFMTRGVFRLDVSSSEPSLYTLMEADKNLGCIAPKGIVNVKDNLFFCARDNIYQISPDFRFTPISLPIRDTYQNTANLESSSIIHDIKKNRLLCKFGTGVQVQYSYDLENQLWTKINFNDGTHEAADFFAIKDNLDLYSVRVFDTNPSP
jgi:hypothetical protein